jgi:hypothetical protein
MTTTLIDRINSLRDRLQVSIYFGKNFTSYSDKRDGKFWVCTFKFENNGIILEIDRREGSPEEAIEACWNEFETIARTGLGLEDHVDEL